MLMDTLFDNQALSEVMSKKMILVSKSVIEPMLKVETDDGSCYFQSDITLMKNVHINEDVSPVVADELRARATIRNTTSVDGVSDAELINNIKPRSVQSLNEIDAFNQYNRDSIVTKVETEAKEEEYNKLKESILNQPTD